MDECMLNDLLECSVCLERLDTSSKVLPCQHTFCKKCLEEIVSTHRELRCPECRVLVSAKVDDLPPNVLLMRILEGMRNATPKGNKTPQRHHAPQRLLGGHQVTPSSPSITLNPPIAIVTPESAHQINVAAKQVHLHNRPYGRAIYDYISKVPGDLSFRKGDIIILRKKIDNNWYHGECGSNHGVFPLSYVQVMTPLPPHVPQCKALYDFRMSNDEEDGCLTFNKGEVISVIRRVDENWAEGKLLDRIGIFPLAFVELNSVARALMKLSTNVQPGPSRVAPPTPTNEETTPLIPTDHTRTVQASNQPRQQATVKQLQNPALPVSDSSSNVSSGGSSTTTSSPVITSPSSSSSSTTPSSPSSPAISPPTVANRHSTKRHSFTAVNSAHQPQPQHRHSAEILSLAVDAALAGAEAATNDPAFTSSQTSGSAGDQNPRHKRSGSSDLVLSQASSMTNSAPAGSSSASSSGATAAAASGVGSNLPAAYIALYPYKPQKADELELRKGGIYMVTERCQDGWFKGTSNRTQKCGVFPGNYVAPAKCQRGVCRSPSTVPLQNSASGTSSSASNIVPASQPSNASSEPRMPVTYTKVKGAAPQPYKLPPPELPPRALSPGPAGSSAAWHSPRQQPNQTQSPPRLPDQTVPVAAASIGRSHSAVMPSIFTSPGKLPLVTTTAATASSLATTTSVSDASKSPINTAHAATASASASSSTATPKSTEKVKEKKEKGVSLMRRLTNIKKSKSPPPSTYSMDNPVFDDGNAGQSLSINPIHVRSGSCPSQLLQVGSPQDINASTNSHHRMYPSQGHVTTSQRVKHKERPSLPVTFLQRSGESGGIITGTMSNHHRKSNSLDAGTGKQVKQQLSSRDRERMYRFRCIVPYPPNSEFELELRVGDIIYVHKKRDDGWYKGTQQRTGRTGLFPASFVEAF
ncbi:E3 ubiquitin-protein ligase SH3RF3 isoform X2 [Nasonia vitripennis]|uniref:RING-type E3 ubiquitin transferase n=1 Tax=Nasonia vitripennis TaxID=7425 RepID=A0A7M7H238_NASVI|nr:E3 ubiquitin-protein ligase SH3RF3 isoform X2 [Nasonia vitripennis]